MEQPGQQIGKAAARDLPLLVPQAATLGLPPCDLDSFTSSNPK
jgi:hypothetical protein